MTNFIKELFGFNKPKTVNVTFSETKVPEQKVIVPESKKYIAITGRIPTSVNTFEYTYTGFDSAAFVTVGDKVGFWDNGFYFEGVIKDFEVVKNHKSLDIYVILSIGNQEIRKACYGLFPLENQNYKIHKEFSVFKIEQDAANKGKYKVFYQNIDYSYRDRFYSSDQIINSNLDWKEMDARVVRWLGYSLVLKGAKKIYHDYRGKFKDELKEKNKHRVDIPAAFKTKERALKYINAVKKRITMLEAEYKKNVELEKKYKAEAIIVE